MWFFYVHCLVIVLEVLRMLPAACWKETYMLSFFFTCSKGTQFRYHGSMCRKTTSLTVLTVQSSINQIPQHEWYLIFEPRGYRWLQQNFPFTQPTKILNNYHTELLCKVREIYSCPGIRSWQECIFLDPTWNICWTLAGNRCYSHICWKSKSCIPSLNWHQSLHCPHCDPTMNILMNIG